MPEESSATTGDRHDNDVQQEARRREDRWWKGGLIAALVFLGLATLYNGIAYRKLTRAQQNLALSLTRQAYRPGPGSMGSIYGRGFAGQPYPPPYAGPWAYYGRPDWGWHRWQHPEQRHEGGQGGPSTPG